MKQYVMILPLIKWNGKIKCDCEFNYYFDSDQKKQCLGKDEKCPGDRYLVQDTKECVLECIGDYQYKHKYDKKCFKYIRTIF